MIPAMKLPEVRDETTQTTHERKFVAATEWGPGHKKTASGHIMGIWSADKLFKGKVWWADCTDGRRGKDRADRIVTTPSTTTGCISANSTEASNGRSSGDPS